MVAFFKDSDIIDQKEVIELLIQFRFQNFKSFRDDTILDMTATKITEHGDRVAAVAGEKLLTAAAIFGANASGKSNVIEAFRFMATYVVQSAQYSETTKKVYSGNNRIKDVERIVPPPFLLDADSEEAETSFEVYFTGTGAESRRGYNYGFTLNEAGVVEEWLNVKAKTAAESRRIFYRKGEELDMPGISSRMQENICLSLGPETLVASLGSTLRNATLRAVRNWFYDWNFTDFGDPFENAILSRQLPQDFLEESVQRTVVSYLSAFDPSIVGFQVEQDEKGQVAKVDAIHRTKDGGTVALPLAQESSGTLKMFSLYPYLEDTLRTGSILFIDELNARLHPLLVRSFLLAFLNPAINTNHAQIIFTTHDAWQLSNHLLRRDEIWFTEKAGDGSSTLYSLADFVDEEGGKIRKDENYEKNYLLGKYGAIPTLKCLDMLGGE